MNAYLIAAKANAWEINQHVGRAVDAHQPDYLVEASGCGEGFCRQGREDALGRHKGLRGIFGLN